MTDESRTKAPLWRRIVGAILVVIGCLLVPVSVSALWVRNTLLDTDNYVATVGPLASNEQIQQALASNLSNAIFTRVDVDERVKDALPPKGEFLAAPIASAVQGFIDQASLRLFESEKFQTFWENANRRAHTAVVALLTGGGPRVETTDGTVAINTEQIFENVKQRLDERGITIFDDVTLPPDRQQFVLFESKDLESAQGAVDLLQKLAWVLPVIALACFGGAIALSSHRRKTIQRIGLGIVLAVALQLVALKLGRNLYLEAISGRRGAAGAVWDQITVFLRTSSLTMIAVALVIAIAAWLAGPSPSATSIRGLWNRALGGSGTEDATTGAITAFVARSKTGLRIVGAALAFIVLIAWNHPTPLTVLGVGLLLLIYLGLIEFLGRGGVTVPTTNQ